MNLTSSNSIDSSPPRSYDTCHTVALTVSTTVTLSRSKHSKIVWLQDTSNRLLGPCGVSVSTIIYTMLISLDR